MNKQINTNLIASIAVFSELCNSESDIKSIMNEFIKSIYSFEKSISLNSIEIVYSLKKHFDFDIPDAVVINCLNKLKSEGFVFKEKGKYNIVDKSYSIKNFDDKFRAKLILQKNIEKELIKYFKKSKKNKVTIEEEKELINNFISYIIDNSVNDKYSRVISKFFIDKSNDSNFINEINQIKEGLVLITGLKYTEDINNIGTWEEELTFYLDTEHLFNLAGFNGKVYEKLFMDFYDLVNEINNYSIKKSNKILIHFKYFESVKKDFDNFFTVAQRIIRKEENYSPEKTAMEEICRGCTSVTDILQKKSSFETLLITKGITLHTDVDYYSKPEYNIEDLSLIEKYKNTYDEKLIMDILQCFTKINYHRKGLNRTNFEKCKHVILTGTNLTLQLSKDLEIKNDMKDIPFATDICFITNRIWFKLNKGLSKSKKLPSTLDIITKAQIVLSSQINGSISKNFEDIKNRLKNKETSESDAQNYYYHLREQTKRPEDITKERINEIEDFIFDNDYDKFMKEYSNLKIQAEEGKKAQKTLDILKKKEYFDYYDSKRKLIKRKIKIISFSIRALVVLILILIPYLIYLLLNSLKTEQDTNIGIFSIVFTLLVEFVGLLSFFNKLNIRLKRYIKKLYKTKIKKLK